jgi:hypothetical protein
MRLISSISKAPIFIEFTAISYVSNCRLPIADCQLAFGRKQIVSIRLMSPEKTQLAIGNWQSAMTYY